MRLVSTRSRINRRTIETSHWIPLKKQSQAEIHIAQSLLRSSTLCSSTIPSRLQKRACAHTRPKSKKPSYIYIYRSHTFTHTEIHPAPASTTPYTASLAAATSAREARARPCLPYRKLCKDRARISSRVAIAKARWRAQAQ